MSQQKDSNPSIIARETLHQLASLKTPPTPDNYHKLYDQIAGNPSNQMCAGTTKMLSEFAAEFPRHTPILLDFANSLETAVKNKNWSKYKEILQKVVSIETSEVAAKVEPESKINWSNTIETLLKQLESKHDSITSAKKREKINRVLSKFTKDPKQLNLKLRSLMNSWEVLASTSKESAEIETDIDLQEIDSLEPKRLESESIDKGLQVENTALSVAGNYADQFLTLIALILGRIAEMPLVDNELANEANNLIQKLNDINNQQEMDQFVSNFRKFGVNFGSCGEKSLKLQQGLLRLVNLLVDNARKLLAGDQWINDQFGKLQETISNPLDLHMVKRAEHCLEEITRQQKIMSSCLGEATITIKQLVASLICNIEGLSDTTGEYHDKIEGYAEQISQAEDIKELNDILVEIMHETSQMQKKAVNYREDLLTARAEVGLAQSRIIQLESELRQMGEKVHEDYLTRILNRRGLDEAYEREVARAARQKSPLCYALLDIDDFKKLNDAHGHKVGDDVLVYLVEAVKQTTRMEDIVARYGGEEFVVLLPDTNLNDAMTMLSRIKRNLTRKFFLHENKRLLITFSAGLAEYQQGESQESVFKRADEALYRAKKNGKNQILKAL